MTVVFLRPKSLSPQWGFQQPDLGLAYCVSYLKSQGLETRYHDLVEAADAPEVPEDAWAVLSASDYTMNNDGSPTIAEARSILAAIGRPEGRKTVFVGPYARHALKTVPEAIAIDRESDPERPLHCLDTRRQDDSSRTAAVQSQTIAVVQRDLAGVRQDAIPRQNPAQLSNDGGHGWMRFNSGPGIKVRGTILAGGKILYTIAKYGLWQRQTLSQPSLECNAECNAAGEV